MASHKGTRDAAGEQRMRENEPVSEQKYPGNVANMLVDILSSKGIDPDTFLQLEQFDTTKLDDADAMYSGQEYIELIQRAIELTGDSTLGLRLGAMINVATYADLGLFAMTAPTVVAAFRETEPFIYQQFSFMVLEILPSEDAFRIRFIEQSSTKFDLFKLDMVMICVHSIAKFLCGGEYPLREVHYRFGAPEWTGAHVESFGAPIFWNSEHHQLVYEPEQANWPVIFADRLNHSKAREQLEKKVSQQRIEHQVRYRFAVRKLVCDSLPKVLTLDEIACTLNISVRTLTRNLSKEQINYREILDQVRKLKARESFKHGATIQQVASDLGYKDTASFARAFNRWYKKNPGAYIQEFQNNN